MPIVPQVTAPTVQQHVGGATPVHAYVPSSEAYERTFATAMKTLNDGINTATKAMEVADARYVKAQSDDAETQIMGAINTTLYDKDTGYFTQKGKNAIDTFKPTLEGLNKNVQEITDKLDPRVREVLKSRVEQRMQNVVSSMNRWFVNESNRYNIESSESRINALVVDRRNHYSDLAYIGKTDVSIRNELALLAKYQGKSQEWVTSQYKKIIDGAELQRFQTMSYDSPQEAFILFNRTKDNYTDPAVRIEIEKSVKSNFVNKCYPALIGSKAVQDHDPDAPVDLEGFSSLDRASRIKMIELAQQESSRASSFKRIEFTSEVENSIADVGATGNSDNFVSYDKFLNFYQNSEVAEEKYAEYESNFFTAQKIQGIRGLSVDNVQALIKASKPASGARKVEFVNYERFKSAAKQYIDSVQKDWIGTFTANNIGNIKPLSVGSPEEVAKQINARLSLAQYAQKEYKTGSLQVMSSAETKAIVSDLESSKTPTEIEARLLSYRNRMEIGAFKAFTDQVLKEDKYYGLALATIDEKNGVSRRVISGFFNKKNKLVKVSDSARQDIAQILGDPIKGTSVCSDIKSFNEQVDIAELYMYSEPNITASDAVKATYGNVATRRGKQILLPNGFSASDVDSAISRLAESKEDSTKKLYFGANKQNNDTEGNVLRIGQALILDTSKKLTEQDQQGGVRYKVLTKDGIPVLEVDEQTNTFKPYYIDIKGDKPWE